MATTISLTSITATPTLSNGDSSATAAAIIPLNLTDATLSENTELGFGDSYHAMKSSIMRPPADGKAACSLDVDLMDRIPSGNLVRVLASINVGKLNSQSRRSFIWKRVKDTSCSLQILVNDTSVYDESLFTTNGDFNPIRSSKFEASKTLTLSMIQECGNDPLELIIAGPGIANEESNAQLPGPTATDHADRGAVCLFKRKRSQRARPEDTGGLHEKPQLHSECIPRNPPEEAEGRVIYEMEGWIPQPVEMNANEVPARELPSEEPTSVDQVGPELT
ncbi:cell surface glycoprotein 1 [Fusarium mundagurra]|uniref:Cell surface glycoprotein 1 n=1 Tax=Fusarium mundagurra TaxID=1567541 RepID=A0A8H5Z5E7_9HYPO|nr:cell surface glycoprotein 1 [Fusarium mundagurra]